MIINPDEAERQQNMLSAVDDLVVPRDYQSQDPASLRDIDIREFGQLVRIHDEAATFFYNLHCCVKPHFIGKVDSSTLGKAIADTLHNGELFALLKSLLLSYDETIKNGMFCIP